MMDLIFASDKELKEILDRARVEPLDFLRQELPPGAMPRHAAVRLINGQVITLALNTDAVYDGAFPGIAPWFARGFINFRYPVEFREWIRRLLAPAYLANARCLRCGRQVLPPAKHCGHCSAPIMLNSIIARATNLLQRRLNDLSSRLTSSYVSWTDLCADTPRELLDAAQSTWLEDNPHLHSFTHQNEILFFTSPLPAPEPTSLLRQLLSRRNSPQRRQTRAMQLAQSRARISFERDRAIRQLAQMEADETALHAPALAAQGLTQRRRVATHILQLRRDISRITAMDAVLSKQIDIINAHLHNLTLASLNTTGLPDSEMLADTAAQAESTIADLQATSELAATLQSNTTTPTEDPEITALMLELEGEPAKPPASEPTHLVNPTTPIQSRVRAPA